MHWTQVYDPFGHWWLSTIVAALPIVVLLGLLARCEAWSVERDAPGTHSIDRPTTAVCKSDVRIATGPRRDAPV